MNNESQPENRSECDGKLLGDRGCRGGEDLWACADGGDSEGHEKGGVGKEQ